VNIFSTSAMKDSVRLIRSGFLSSLAYFLYNCHTTACPSLTTTNSPSGRGPHYLFRGELEAA